jgi:hypothetical protein
VSYALRQMQTGFQFEKILKTHFTEAIISSSEALLPLFTETTEDKDSSEQSKSILSKFPFLDSILSWSDSTTKIITVFKDCVLTIYCTTYQKLQDEITKPTITYLPTIPTSTSSSLSSIPISTVPSTTLQKGNVSIELHPKLDDFMKQLDKIAHQHLKSTVVTDDVKLEIRKRITNNIIDLFILKKETETEEEKKEDIQIKKDFSSSTDQLLEQYRQTGNSKHLIEQQQHKS